MTTLLEALAFFEFITAWLIISLQYRGYPSVLHLPGASPIFVGELEFWLMLLIATGLYAVLTYITHSSSVLLNTDPVVEAVRLQKTAMYLWIKAILMAIFFTIAVAGTSWEIPRLLSRSMKVLPVFLVLVPIAFAVKIHRTRRSAV